MTPVRLLGAVLVLGLVVPLAGCGKDPIEEYCSALRQDQKQIAEMIESTSPTSLLSNLSLLRGLAEKAPDDLQDEWQVFVSAIEGLDEALDDADVASSDFVNGKPPAGLGAEDRKAIVAAAGQLASDEVSAAATGIDQQARDVCKINLGLG